MNTNVEIGNVLRKLRKENNLTQGQLADLVGVSHSAIGMYEQGNRRPTYAILFKIAEVFGTTTDYLLKGDAAFDDEDFSSEEMKHIDAQLSKWAKKGMLTAFENYNSWNYKQKRELINLLEKAYNK